jgi:hypothetical protein
MGKKRRRKSGYVTDAEIARRLSRTPMAKEPLVQRLIRQLEGDPDKKVAWSGRLTSVQPRIRLTRSFDESSHTYLGYALRVDGRFDEEEREFWLGVGKGAPAKHQFEQGMVVSGECRAVANAALETVEFYKVSKIQVGERREKPAAAGGPPWPGVPPELPVYRERGHRRLAARTYSAKCSSCIWGCSMPVEMIIDQWNPQQRKYRTETFCYGPKSCSLYRPGPRRVVPGRHGMRFVEEDWIDESATSGRGPDD